jgi:3-hexulose-6-phosphate synthase
MKAHSRSSTIFVAGGITIGALPRYMELGADVVIVGGGIRNAADPVKEARAFHELMRRGDR